MFRRLGVFLTTFIVCIVLFSTEVSAQAINLRDYIAGPDFTPHELSTGEFVRFTAEGGMGPGSPVRQYKNTNYEQFFINSDFIYRREDTSWAPLPGFGDALCQGGGKAAYALDTGACSYSNGGGLNRGGAGWAPSNVALGSSWITQNHNIVPVSSAEATNGNIKVCQLQNLSGYPACNQTNQLKLSAVHRAGTFTFCTGIKNVADLIIIQGVSGAGTGDTFFYMKGWGLVGFEAPGLQVGLMGDGANPGNCIGSNYTPGGGLILPPTHVPCNAFTEPEYHSLRPYPASPCNPYVSETTMLCANDLVTKETFKVLPTDALAGSCRSVEGKTRCDYEIQSQVQITVNNAAAQLPIAGNTQLVPNAEKPFDQGPGMTSAQRVNEYVSWYLNGVNNRAEEPYLGVGEDDQKKLIDYSGPLNKLLPWSGLNEKRMETVAQGVIANYTRHNQIAACALGAFPLPCNTAVPAEISDLTEIISRLIGTFRAFRVAEWAQLPPPNADDYETVAEFWQAYQTWRGSICSGIVNVLGKDIFLCSNLESGTNAQLFPYIPLSNTEDRKGNITSTLATGQPAQDEGVEVLNLQFTPTTPDLLNPAAQTEVLYFAHMEETDDLGRLLQNTYAPVDEERFQIPPDTPQIPAHCEIVSAKTNPGDNLDEEKFLNEQPRYPEEESIKGTVNYTAKFSCDFDPPTIDPITGALIYSPCEKIALTAASLAVGTPKAQRLWDRFVDGPMSVFKRFFPKVGPDGPVERIEEIPGYTNTQYTALSQGVSDGTVTTEALAGDPSRDRPGTSAQMYFPYLGSVQEYFLDGIQKALRPLGIGSSTSIGNTPPGEGYAGAACNPENFTDFGADAEKVACVCDKESVGGRANALNDGCLTTGPNSTWDYSVGLFQINLLVHPNVASPDLIQRFREAGYQNAEQLNCPNAFSSIGETYKDGKIFRMREACVIQDQKLLDICVDYFSDPSNNARYAADLAKRGGWGHWSLSASACGLL